MTMIGIHVNVRYILIERKDQSQPTNVANLTFTIVFAIILSCHHFFHVHVHHQRVRYSFSRAPWKKLQMLGRRSVSLLAACHKIITQSKQSGKVIGEHCIIN